MKFIIYDQSLNAESQYTNHLRERWSSLNVLIHFRRIITALENLLTYCKGQWSWLHENYKKNSFVQLLGKFQFNASLLRCWLFSNRKALKTTCQC